MSAEVELIDRLIARLNAIVETPEDVAFQSGPDVAPKPATFRFTHKSSRDTRLHPAEAIAADPESVTLVSKQDAVRQMPVEVRIVMGKTGRGEVFRVVDGVVRQTRRVSGGYEMAIQVTSTRREQVTAEQRLREALARDDAAQWERWCADLTDGARLVGADLKGARLVGYDLARADLAGANLAGADLAGADLAAANLEKTVLDGARVAGTDFFRCRISSAYASLVAASGTPETESVVFLDS